MVQSNLLILQISSKRNNCFNSTMVQSNHFHSYNQPLPSPRFNSTMVQSNQTCYVIKIFRYTVSIPRWFNQTSQTSSDIEIPNSFQFHDGSIKPGAEKSVKDGIDFVFQFHDGSIKPFFKNFS